MNEQQRLPLAQGKVCHVGDTVAMVVAEDPDTAQLGVEALDIDFERLDAVADASAALEPGAPLVHERFGTNQVCDWEIGDADAVAQAFTNAAHITELDLVQNRIAGSPIEPRACIGRYDPGTDDYTLYTSSQNPHLISPSPRVVAQAA